MLVFTLWAKSDILHQLRGRTRRSYHLGHPHKVFNVQRSMRSKHKTHKTMTGQRQHEKQKERERGERRETEYNVERDRMQGS